MRASNKLWGLLTFVLILAFVFPAFAFSRPASPETAAIHLKSQTFNPANGEQPRIPPGLAVAEEAIQSRGYGYYLVQFSGPVQDSWKTQLQNMGADILEYIPDFAFKVRMPPGQAKKLQNQPQIAYVGPFQPAYKLSPDLAQSSIALYRITVERGGDLQRAAKELAQAGATVMRLSSGSLLVAADGAQLAGLAQVMDVAWIENFRMIKKHSASQNEAAAGTIMGANVAYSRGYDGSTQIVGVADTGLGGGATTNAHADIPTERIVAIYNWPGATDSCWYVLNDGSVDVDSGHGTHVAVSVLGDGSPTGVAKGIAPAARLVFQSTENYAIMQGACASYYTSGYYLTGLPDDLRTLFQQAYDAGARIHSNSWGSAAAGDYTLESLYADDFAWTHKDMLITFSAGNEGIDANSDGAIDNDSIGAPATAKNVLTLGASENQRPDGYPCDTSLTYNSCAAQGGQNVIFTWGSAWPSSFPANPISGDVSAGNAQQMAAFSSRGPADDGRIKPDLVAPGSWILSGYSDLYQQGYDPSPNTRNNAFQYDGYGYPYSAQYKYMSGTSMSNPLAAGGAALVRDFYNKAYGVQASAALVKADLVNSAVDLLDENNDGANDNDFPIPNSAEGWGLVNLDNATDGTARFVDQSSGLATGAGQTFYYAVAAGSAFKVTLAWSDYPSTETAAINLVNDLDLTVTAPDGTVYRGNAFSGGWSVSGGSADRRNNLENVYIQSPVAGTWTVQVSGYNVPNGPQPFALVVDGLLSDPGPTPTVAPATATPLPPTATPVPPTATPLPGPLSTGFISPSANSAVTKNAGDNNGFELNPMNAYASDNQYALDANSGTSTSTTCGNNKKDKHIFYSFPLAVPGAASILGLEVKLEGRADSGLNAPQFCIELSTDGGLTWTAARTTGVLNTSDAVFTLGSPSDLWGRSWTASQLSSLRVRITSISSSTSRDFYLDALAVNVTYR